MKEIYNLFYNSFNYQVFYIFQDKKNLPCNLVSEDILFKDKICISLESFAAFEVEFFRPQILSGSYSLYRINPEHKDCYLASVNRNYLNDIYVTSSSLYTSVIDYISSLCQNLKSFCSKVLKSSAPEASVDANLKSKQQ